MRLDGLPKLGDLREMSEEQFVEAFEILRGRTKGWTEFTPQFMIEDSRCIFILRCALGLTQREFSQKLGVDRGTLRATEAGRSRLVHLKPAKRWTSKISSVLSEIKPSIDTAVAKFIEHKRAADGFKFQRLSKPVTSLTGDELFSLFKTARKLTKGFTSFSPKILMESPRLLLIFRLLLGLSHDKFAHVLGIDERALRSREKGRESIGRKIGTELSSKLEQLFSLHKPKPDFQTVLRHFRLFRIFLHDDLEKDIEHGLAFAKSRPPSEIEKEIKLLLESSRIEFGLHPIVQGLKRKLCVDFTIPEHSPQFVIEAFSFSLVGRPLGQVLKRVRETDHRFRMIKLKEPKIKCIMCIRFSGKDIPTDKIKEFIELELLDTDVLLVGEEIQKLPKVLKK